MHKNTPSESLSLNQDPLANLAPMRNMGSRLRVTHEGSIFHIARVGILAELSYTSVLDFAFVTLV